ncbi:MAG: DUF4321 domain-containing protein [Firmicutes bacterium]|nr:DUF4321 domain-containing protein [Bacillota bacterium]
MRRGKSGWLLVFFLVVGSFIGSLLGQALGGIAPWLNLSSQPYGINPPLVLSLDIFTLTFGFTMRLTVAGVLGLILGLLLYKRL